mgnify:CR=1 FL=1
MTDQYPSNIIGLMKRLWLIVPLIFLLFITSTVAAQSSDSKKVQVTSIEKNETVNRTYFAANERVEIAGTVNGDVFVAGGVLLVTGKINGDLIAAGGEVTVSGEVSDDIRVTGGQIRISGKIGKNLTVAGGSVDITESASIGKALIAFGGNVNVNAPVGTTINSGAGTLTLNSSVGGDVDAGVGVLRLTSKAVVKGNITYWSDTEASIDDSALVSGEITKKTSPTNRSYVDKTKILGIIAGFSLALKLANLLVWFVMGLLLIKFVPGFFDRSVNTLKEQPWSALGVGFLALVLTPILAVVLMVTLVGIPFGIVLLALYGILLYFVRVLVTYLIGEWLMGKFGWKIHQVWALLIGLVVYGILTIIPVIGGLVGLFATLLGLGGWLISKKQIYTEARKKNLI